MENIKVKDSNVIDTVDNREGSVLLIDHEIGHK
jgi:hypothetical protein